MTSHTPRRSPATRRTSGPSPARPRPSSGRPSHRPTSTRPPLGKRRRTPESGNLRGPSSAASLRPPKRIIAPAHKSVMFSLDAPESRQAAVAGAFNDWAPQDMARGIDGIWRLTVLLPTGTHAYRFLVDGVWMPDPSNPRRQVNDIGGHDSVCTVM